MDLNRTATLSRAPEIEIADLPSPMPSDLVCPSEAEQAVAKARRLNTEAQALRLRVRALLATGHVFAISVLSAVNDCEPDKIEALRAPARA